MPEKRTRFDDIGGTGRNYLEGHGDLVSRVIIRITRVTIRVIGILTFLLSPTDPFPSAPRPPALKTLQSIRNTRPSMCRGPYTWLFMARYMVGRLSTLYLGYLKLPREPPSMAQASAPRRFSGFAGFAGGRPPPRRVSVAAELQFQLYISVTQGFIRR